MWGCCFENHRKKEKASTDYCGNFRARNRWVVGADGRFDGPPRDHRSLVQYQSDEKNLQTASVEHPQIEVNGRRHDPGQKNLLEERQLV